MIQVRTLSLVALVLFVLVILPTLVFGAGMPGPIVTCDGINCTICDIAQVAQNVLNTAVYVSVFLSAILFAWAGWLYLTSAANESGIGEAKKIFGNVVVGLIIILCGWLVIDTVMKTFVPESGGFGPWYQICRR